MLTCAFLPSTALSPLSLSKCITEPPGGAKVYKDSWDFGPYLEILNAAVGDPVFQRPAWIKEYFTWAGFKDYNLVVRVGHSSCSFLLSWAVGVDGNLQDSELCCRRLSSTQCCLTDGPHWLTTAPCGPQRWRSLLSLPSTACLVLLLVLGFLWVFFWTHTHRTQSQAAHTVALVTNAAGVATMRRQVQQAGGAVEKVPGMGARVPARKANDQHLREAFIQLTLDA